MWGRIVSCARFSTALPGFVCHPTSGLQNPLQITNLHHRRLRGAGSQLLPTYGRLPIGLSGVVLRVSYLSKKRSP